eukprot:CAMPEP_0119035860 /NCGR_PEP_ID=MMETSP1177-20130426/3120_1 /TAXON_ID=2985 /ORGANISM="Ochromonas sp, Strain CCMP1899" /LENGTH=513 /DNA_ID=CAMNT_0006994715 /DNA_START=324 /DNA_END=1865 /DNA_ORIENTATION=-
MMRHFKMHSIAHICPIETCKMQFETSVALLQHKRLHDNQCKTCGEIFQSLSDLRIHRLKIHNESDFRCSQDGCTAAFASKAQLKNHQGFHMNQFVCLSAGCLKLFGTIEEYQLHIKCHILGGLIAFEDISTNVPATTTKIATAAVTTIITAATAPNIMAIASTHDRRDQNKDLCDGDDEILGSQRSSIKKKRKTGQSLSSSSSSSMSASSSSPSAKDCAIIEDSVLSNNEKNSYYQNLSATSATTEYPLSTELITANDSCLPCSDMITPIALKSAALVTGIPIEASTLNINTSSQEIPPSELSPKSKKRQRLEKEKVTRKLRNSELECPSMASVISEKQMRINSHNSTVYPFLNRGRKKKEKDDADINNANRDDHSSEDVKATGHICPHPTCDRSFSRKSNLLLHVKAYHASTRPFTCSIEGCGQSFGFKHVLERHNINIHIKGKNPRIFVYPSDVSIQKGQLLLGNSTAKSLLERNELGATSSSSMKDTKADYNNMNQSYSDDDDSDCEYDI